MSANRIVLLGDFRQEEGLASGTVKPGHLVELTTATAQTFKAHATEGGFAERAFAIEDALQGKTISDSYSTTTLVQVALVVPGAVVQAYLKSGKSCSVGTELISAGDGTLIPYADAASETTVEQIVGRALEAKTTVSGDTLIRVRVA